MRYLIQEYKQDTQIVNKIFMAKNHTKVLKQTLNYNLFFSAEISACVK